MLYRNKQKPIRNLTPGSIIIDLSIAKQRNGPIGDTRLLFNKYLTKFEDDGMIEEVEDGSITEEVEDINF